MKEKKTNYCKCDSEPIRLDCQAIVQSSKQNFFLGDSPWKISAGDLPAGSRVQKEGKDERTQQKILGSD